MVLDLPLLVDEASRILDGSLVSFNARGVERVHFLVLLGEAYTFRSAELDLWLGEIGFDIATSQAVADGFSLLVARRRTE